MGVNVKVTKDKKQNHIACHHTVLEQFFHIFILYFAHAHKFSGKKKFQLVHLMPKYSRKELGDLQIIICSFFMPKLILIISFN